MDTRTGEIASKETKVTGDLMGISPKEVVEAGLAVSFAEARRYIGGGMIQRVCGRCGACGCVGCFDGGRCRSCGNDKLVLHRKGSQDATEKG